MSSIRWRATRAHSATSTSTVIRLTIRPATIRVADEPTDLDGYTLDRGEIAVVCLYLLQRDGAVVQQGTPSDRQPPGSIQFEQLSEDLTGWTSAEQENIAPGFHGQNFHPVDRTRGWFHHHSFPVREIRDRKDAVGFYPKILGESSILSNTIGP